MSKEINGLISLDAPILEADSKKCAYLRDGHLGTTAFVKADDNKPGFGNISPYLRLPLVYTHVQGEAEALLQPCDTTK